MNKSIPFEDHHFKFLRDPKRARAYLVVILEEYEQDRDIDALRLALSDVTKAQLPLHGANF